MPETIEPADQRPARDPVPLNFPASFSQERLWFVNQLAPQSGAYHLPAIARLHGTLDLAALERSLNEILQRHEVLRAGFELVAGEVRQIVAPSVSCRVQRFDLCSLHPVEREKRLQETIDAEANRPFNLSHPPLLRATLVQLDQTDQVLILLLHHIAADGWSVGILCWELAVLYEAFSAGRPSPLPSLPLQFSDFSAWEREEAGSDRWRQQLKYWQEQLKEVDATSPLLSNRPYPSPRTFRGTTYSMRLPAELTNTLEALWRSERVTPFMLLLAGFQVLLHGYSGKADLLVGTPVVSRHREELEPLIGCLVNLLALRIDASGDPTFREFLRRVKEVVLSATANQEVPFEQVMNELRLKRGPDQTPLLQFLFTFQRGPISLQLPGLESQPLSANTHSAKFDLFMEWWEAGPYLEGRLEYSTDLFDPEIIRQLGDHYRLLLERSAADPDQHLSKLCSMIPKGFGRTSLPVPERQMNKEAGLVGTSTTPQNRQIPSARVWIEEKLAQIWRQVLHLEKVDRTGNFFELGGHSLLMIQVMARVRAAFEITLPLELQFRASTLAELAAVIENRLLREGAMIGQEAGQRS